MTSPLRARTGLAAVAIATGLAACNAIFGLNPGEPTGPSGSTSSSSSGGGPTTSASTSSSSTSSSTSSTSSSTSTGDSGPMCSGGTADGSTTTWAKHVGGYYSTTADGLAFTSDGGLVVAGAFSDGNTIFGGKALDYPVLDGQDEDFDLYVAKYSKDGLYQWAYPFGGVDRQWLRSVAVDASDNIYVTGFFRGSVTFGGTTLTADPVDMLDAYLAKLDPNGNALWAVRLGGPQEDEALQVAVDPSGNVVVAGATYGGSGGAGVMADFGCGAKLIPDGHSQIWLSKFAPDGNNVWCQPYDVDTGYMGYFNPPMGLSLATLPSGDIVLAGGAYLGTASFGQGALDDHGGREMFVFVADPSGKYRWASSFGDANDQWITQVAADACGNIFVAGGFLDSVTFGSKTVSYAPDLDAGQDVTYGHMFVGKLTPTSDPSNLYAIDWLEIFTDFGTQQVTALAASADGDLVFGGNLSDQPDSKGVDFGNGTPDAPSGAYQPGDYYRSDAFVTKLQPTGQLRWTHRYGTPNWDSGRAVALDAAGRTALGGTFSEAIDFGKGLFTPKSEEMFVVRYGP
jgi:hypothetical protein